MKEHINIPTEARVKIEWSDDPINYSYQNKNKIISYIKDKYGISKDHIKVAFIPKRINEKGEEVNINTEIIENIQDLNFQLKLFKDYLRNNDIKNYDWDFIKSIDSHINSKIDYDKYEKYKRYSIEWLEWSNFLSYGNNNKLNLSELNGLVLLTSIPGNQGGKTNISVDLIKFLLFGKTSKPYSLSQIFNNYTDEKKVIVRGGLKIDDNDYIIERIITRAQKKDGKWGDASQEVKYYQVINGVKELLNDDKQIKNESDEYSAKTNKVIKDAIGNEQDFDLIICATGDNLMDLINIGKAEKGRLFNKWIGLLPIEDKEKFAKEEFKSYYNSTNMQRYNKEDIIKNINEIKDLISTTNSVIKDNECKILQTTNLLKTYYDTKETLLSNKNMIDNDVMKLDIITHKKKIENIINEGVNNKNKIEQYKNMLKNIGPYTIVTNELTTHRNNERDIAIKKSIIETNIQQLKNENSKLEKKEICPILSIRCKDLDNSKTINENNEKIKKLVNDLNKIKNEQDNEINIIKELEIQEQKYKEASQLELKIAKLETDNSELRGILREMKELEKKYNINKEIIDKNNEIDIKINNINVRINNETIYKEKLIRDTEGLKKEVDSLNKKNEENELLLKTISDEEKKVYNWKLYLEMIGKNGISKMVLRNIIPIINSELYRILDDVCDFDVEVSINDKNEVEFYLVRDDVKSPLGGGSGFERTAAALALRQVLNNMSTMPKPNFITLDELLGKVTRENYDQMKLLYEKIKSSYKFIFHITHLEEIKDWHNQHITVIKENNISRINNKEINI